MSTAGPNERLNFPPRVLFYSGPPNCFRTTLLGYLYEVSRVYPTILVTEKLDSETKGALCDKKLFPKLEKIIPIWPGAEKKTNPFFLNRYYCKFARNLIQKYRPDIVITSGDIMPFFDLYLLRFAKKSKAINISILFSNTAESRKGETLVDLINAHLRFPSFLPLRFRLFLVKTRKYFGHFFYYWILPLTIFEKPFLGRSSSVLRKGQLGMRDSDYQIVPSKRNYDICVKEGVRPEGLYILSHPLSRKTREIFEKIYFNKFKKDKKRGKVALLLLASEMEFGFRRKDNSLIFPKEREENWIETVKLVERILSSWKIYLKPHPDTKDVNKIRQIFESISPNVEVVYPAESIDRYLELGDIVIGLPFSASTALYSAFLRHPKNPTISLDFFKEILGDFYKNFEGIEYIDGKKKFIDFLEKIRDNRYSRVFKKETKKEKFSNIVDILQPLLEKKSKRGLEMTSKYV